MNENEQDSVHVSAHGTSVASRASEVSDLEAGAAPTEQETPLPCPFCGGTEILDSAGRFGFNSMVCWDCDAIGPDADCDTPSGRIAAWNQRLNQPQGEASPSATIPDAEAAEGTTASSEPDGPASAALPADLTALLLQAVEALEMGRDYINAELVHRKDAYEGYPHRYATEEQDLAHVDRIAAALRQRIGRE